VKSTKDDLRFVLDGGAEYESPSSAGSAVMGGNACNIIASGRRPARPPGRPKKASARKRKTDPRWTGYDFFQSQSNVGPAVWLE
jgi:hypothetical protein